LTKLLIWASERAFDLSEFLAISAISRKAMKADRAARANPTSENIRKAMGLLAPELGRLPPRGHSWGIVFRTYAQLEVMLRNKGETP